MLEDNFGVAHISPRVLPTEVIPPLLSELVGEYRFVPYFTEETIASLKVYITDDVLMGDVASEVIPDPVTLVLNPISDTEILIVGGPWDGETIFYDSATGDIHWGGMIAKPLEEG